MCVLQNHFGSTTARLTAAFLVVASGIACAQKVNSIAERESLTNPVYRINNSESSDAAPAPAEGKAATAVPSEEPAASVATRTGSILSASKPSAVEPKIEPKIESKPEISVEPSPSQVLGQAVTDARRVLGYLETNVTDYTCDFIKRETGQRKVATR